MNVTPSAPVALFERTEAVSRVRALHKPPGSSAGVSPASPNLRARRPHYYSAAQVHGPNACEKRKGPPHEPEQGRQVLDCASPLALSHPARARKSGRGLPHSKTLSRPATARGEFMVRMRAQTGVGPSQSKAPEQNRAAHLLSQRAQGFTLLEVLIAAAVFAIVLAAASTVFYGALHLRNGASEALEQSLPPQQALAVIERDLANLVVPTGLLSGVFQTTSITNAVGGQSSPDFYTSTGFIDPTSPWGEIQRVSYLLTDPTDRAATGRDLVRVITRNLLPAVLEEEPARQWLMSGVQGVTFNYYDGTQWRDSWDSTMPDPTTGLTNNLPQAIKVQIQLATRQSGRGASAAAPIEFVVPIVAQARTNKTQQATGGG